MLLFTDKLHQPTDADIAAALGDRLSLLHAVLREAGITATAWKFYSKSSGWTLQCRRGDTNVFFLQITNAGFYVWFTLGRRAKEQALQELNDEVLKQEIAAAKEYREGTSFKVAVTQPEDVAVVTLLAGIKMEGRVGV